MKIKYVGGVGPVVIPATGQTVENDATVDVPDAIAGTPPSAAFLAANDALAAAHLRPFFATDGGPDRHLAVRTAVDALVALVDEAGEGLLAQFDTWVLPPKTKTAPKDGE